MVIGACIWVLREEQSRTPLTAATISVYPMMNSYGLLDWQVLGTPMSETCDELSTSNLPKLQICAVATEE